jgi:hypothetical protein
MPDLRTDPVTVAQLLQADNLYWTPLFQREYVWQKSKITMLFEDALTLVDERSDSRFLGAIVLEAEEPRIGHPTRYWVIDGQQRLTTLFIILVAIVGELNRLGESERASSLAESYLLVSAAGAMKNEPKYRPTVLDTSQFNVVLRSMRHPDVVVIEQPQGPEAGRMVQGLKLTQRLLKKQFDGMEDEVAVEWLWEFASCLLTGVRFVSITLGDDHEPTEVFDRLNARGEPLKVIDLVRNDVMKVVAKDLDKAVPLRDQFWLPFHDAFGGNESAEQKYFFPLALTRDQSVKKSQVFEMLARRWDRMRDDSENRSPENLVRIAIDDLREYQDAYCALILTGALDLTRSELAPEDRTALNLRINRLQRLSASVVTMPYLMQVVNGIVDLSIPVKEGVACLDVIESFLVRRAIMGMEPTGLHAVFKGLWDPEDFDVESLEERLTTATVVFPSDAEFSHYVQNGRLYNRKIDAFVLWERELGYPAGDQHQQLLDFHVSHIIPRNLTDEELAGWNGWSKEEWQALKNTWANLVPLSPAGNWQMGRRNWSDMCELLEGNLIFKTPQHLLLDYESWMPDDVHARGLELASWAIGRWPKHT